MPRCPKCYAELEYTDVLDEEFVDDTTIVVDIEGFCTGCGTRYTWKERYYYGGFEKIEEMKDE